MTKVMWCRFEQRFGMFTMLLVEVTSETGLFRHLSNHVFRVGNFGNTKDLRVIFFSKSWKFNLHFKNGAKTRKEFFVSQTVASELVFLNCLYYEQDTFHRQPMCEQAVPTFFMSIRGTISNSIDLAVTIESDKGDVMQIWKVLGHVYHFACQSIFWKGTF